MTGRRTTAQELRPLHLSLGLICVVLGLVLVEVTISSFASSDWLPPTWPFVQFIPALAGLVFLPGIFLILFAISDGK